MATHKKSAPTFTFMRNLKKSQRCEDAGRLGRWFRDLRRDASPTLDRSNPTYHSEGKGLRRRKERDRRRHSLNEQQPDASTPDGKDAEAAERMARDVMMSARSTPNLQQAVPQGGKHHHHHHQQQQQHQQQQHQQQQQQQHTSIYSYLHSQSGLNFVPHRQGDSPPPAPPVRDASSLKGVKCGPGHEKFPSWPVSAAADTPAAARPAPGGGSHRSKSWTDHTNYPKEKGMTYTRPYMKRPNPAFTQQLKTVMERCEKISPETFESQQGRLYLPRLDREGNALGDHDYLAPSPPERDVEEYKAASASLTQADLEEYARTYRPQQQPSYAQSEGYHSYVSSSDSSTTTPFLDRLRRDSEIAGRAAAGPQTAVWDDGCDGRPGRDSVATTSSGSASSGETLKWHGSLSDVSVASSSCTQQGSVSSSSRQLIAHSSRVQTPQRHHSESVLYLGGQARVQRNNQHNKLRLFPVNTYTVQPEHRTQQPLSPSSQAVPSVAERVSELERQTRYTYLHPDKRHRVSDPTLKAIQKKALLSFYERHHHVGSQGQSRQTWRSEPQLARPVGRPQSPPPPRPPPRPRTGQQSPRRASSASDYAGGNWREMAANREAESGSGAARDNARHQHSSSCGSLSSDLLGPLIIGPSISVDDWVPERPPKKPHLRATFVPSVPDRLPSPDLPPPSPPPMLEDEVFASDEPLPPPPPELHDSDWTVAVLENSCESQERLAEYGASSTPRPSESNPGSSHKLSLLRSPVPSTHQETSPPRSSSSSACNVSEHSQPDVIPSIHRHHDYDSPNFRLPDGVLQKNEAVQRHADMSPKNLPEICSVDHWAADNSLQKQPDVSFRYHRYLETGFAAQRCVSTGHRQLETPAPQKQLDMHRLSTSESCSLSVSRPLDHDNVSPKQHELVESQKLSDIISVPRHSSHGNTQKLDNSSLIPLRDTIAHQKSPENDPVNVEAPHQRHVDSNCSSRLTISEQRNKPGDENSIVTSTNVETPQQRHADSNCSSRLTISEQKNKPGDENSIVTSTNVDAPHQRHADSNSLSRLTISEQRNKPANENSIVTSRNVDALHQRYMEGGTLNRRHLESNRSLDGSTSLHRYRSTGSTPSRPSGMRSTENLHQNSADASKYSTQKLVVNGKLASPLGDRTAVHNGGFTESIRSSKREFPSVPARARLQRVPLAVPSSDTIIHIQVSPAHSDTEHKSSSKASHRRDRDLPNFEGSYKRTMSPSGAITDHEVGSDHKVLSDLPTVLSDVQSVEGTTSTPVDDLRLNDCEGLPSPGETVISDPEVVTRDNELEVECDVVTETEPAQDDEVEDPIPPSPPTPKVTESLQLVQRTEVVLRVNAATSDASSQTESEKEVADEPVPVVTSALQVRPKLQEEIECERLSLDLASHLPPSDKLQTLLVPDPEHKKPTDYVTGLFRLDVAPRPRVASSRPQVSSDGSADGLCSGFPASDNRASAEDTAKDNNVSPLPASSKYFQISEPKAKLLNRYVQDMGQLNGLHDDKDLHRKKEELMSRLARKLEVLRGEQLVVTEEVEVNEQLGESVAAQVGRVARPHELGKYRLHVEEVGKITSLLLGLSGRLARAENALVGLPLHHSERKILESKRDKLREQLEEAKKLKENIDRRSVNVSNILYKYFNSEEYADYDHFINMKAKLIMDSREIADKIKLGEEQLAALKETLCCNSFQCT